MQFEVIRKSHKKEITIGVVAIILIAVVLLVRNSFAKYQTTMNLKIAEGTINYTVPDFKIMGIYYQKEGQTCTEDSCYEEKESMPELGYEINTTKSYCTTDNVNKIYNKVFTNEEGKHVITGLSKDSKCYLYFDKQTTKNVNTPLGTININLDSPDFNKTSCSSGCDETTVGIYKTTDETGEDTYYYRGDVTNNYVKFANKFWRVIRINGDGSIRMIYDGETVRANGTVFEAEKSAFNSSYSDNMYVGFKYTAGQAQGTGTKSTILGKLESWYTANLASYAAKIDTNTGFCGDRRRSTTAGGAPNNTGGTGTTKTYYAARYRLSSTKKPELTCEKSDYYTVNKTTGNGGLTYPIGLISADEAAIAGAAYATANQKYYLYTGQMYWTLSPEQFTSTYAYLFVVWTNGSFGSSFVNDVADSIGVRPVINLKADTKFTYKNTTTKGTMNDPYVVE